MPSTLSKAMKPLALVAAFTAVAGIGYVGYTDYKDNQQLEQMHQQDEAKLFQVQQQLAELTQQTLNNQTAIAKLSAPKPNNYALAELDGERTGLVTRVMPETARIQIDFEHATDQGSVQHEESLGSGFIINAAKCEIVTNHHVVNTEGGHLDKLTVTLTGDPKHPVEGTVIGFDTRTDVAVVQTKCDKPLPQSWQVQFADSDNLAVGQWIVAWGNPLGLDGTVTYGGISHLDRVIGEGKYDSLVQIDASINPGNSGGPTFDMDGKVIGMNTAIISQSGSSAGLGFAIPSNMVEEVANSIINNPDHEMHYGFLGIHTRLPDPDVALYMNLAHIQGVMIDEVGTGGPADKAGLEVGDIILSIDGKAVAGEVQSDLDSFVNRIAMMKAGASLHITYMRDGNEYQTTATLGTLPAEKVAKASAPSPDQNDPAAPTSPGDPQSGQPPAPPADQNGPANPGDPNGGQPSIPTPDQLSTDQLQSLVNRAHQGLAQEQAAIDAAKQFLKPYEDELAKRLANQQPAPGEAPNNYGPRVTPGPRAIPGMAP
jgi:S1-C subfamily serine protease